MKINSTVDLVEGLKSGNYKNVFITTHHKPDGDAMGSTLGLQHILNTLGIQSSVITPTDYSESLSWLPGNEQVTNFEDSPEEVKKRLNESDLVFCLDFNILTRINELGDLLAASNKPLVLIDHHQNPDAFYTYAYWNNEASSTCELVFEWARDNFGLDVINQDAVTCLYTGLMTDTGNFQYINTRTQTHVVAAQMMEIGVDHVQIHERIYNVFSVNRTRLFGYCLYKKLEILEDCKTAVIHLNRHELEEFKVVTGDTEGLVNFGLGIKGIVLSVLIVDRTERVKMSFRSKGTFKVNEFAGKFFNGGGHFNAAGGQSEAPLEEALATFKREIQAYKNELNAIEG